MTSLKWRRVQSEVFLYGYDENDENNGYMVDSYVLLNKHETCGCILSRTCVRIQWYFPHSSECHGQFPLHYQRIIELREQLIRGKPWLEIGHCLQLNLWISYGKLIKQW